MIQRIQTLFLTIVVILSSILVVLLFNYVTPCSLIVPILSLVSIFLFKNRGLQMKVVAVTIAMTIISSGYDLYRVYESLTEVLLYSFILMVAIETMFLVLSHRKIDKDDKLVKSYDRLR